MPVDVLELTHAEQELIRAVATGQVADYSSDDPEQNDPRKGLEWGPGRTIRADIICALALQTNSVWPVHARGVQLKGARITGRLDLQSAKVTCPLALQHCYVEERVILKDASIHSMDFYGSYVPGGINGMGLAVEHNVWLGGGFTAESEVVFLNAHIAGSVGCGNGRFENPGGNALRMDGARIRGDVFLRTDFHATGRVRLVGATIGGQFNCSGGKFEGGKGMALCMDGAKVNGGVFLGEGFSASGEVRLQHAKINSRVDCSGGKFENPDGSALVLQSATVDGTLSLGEEFDAEGLVDLRHATAKVLADDEKTWPKPGKLALEGFTYQAVHGTCDAKKRLKWLERERDFHPQPYEQLARVLRQTGYVHGAQKILYAKNKRLRKAGRLGFRGWLKNLVLQFTVGYGYRSWRAAAWMLVLFAAGWGVAWWGWHAGLMIRSQPQVKGVAYPDFHASLYSLKEFSLPPMSLHSHNFWRPYARTARGADYWLFKGYFIFQGLAGWVLAGLLIAALTGIIKKE